MLVYKWDEWWITAAIPVPRPKSFIRKGIIRYPEYAISTLYLQHDHRPALRHLYKTHPTHAGSDVESTGWR